jgi:LacI family transcriptional regulator
LFYDFKLVEVRTSCQQISEVRTSKTCTHLKTKVQVVELRVISEKQDIMRPTTRDLAEAAGVSLATVDRVLNGRPGVRKKTVDAVKSAIQSIGFERNQVAATLARKRGYRLGFVLPKDGDEFLDEIMERIREINRAGRAEMFSVKTIRIDEQNPHKAAESLSRLNVEDFDGIAIMAPETPQIRDAIRRMRERGILIIPFVSNQQNDEHDVFVGIDNRAAGATAGRLMGCFTRSKNGVVAVITDTVQARDSLERRLGFDGVINRDFLTLKVLPTLETYADPDRTHRIIKTIIANQPDLVGIYIMGCEARVPIEVLSQFKKDKELVTIAHERTPSTVAALRDNELDALVAQNPGHLVRSAVRILRAKCENRPTLASQEKTRIEILIADNL